jgi:hypothetical protein
VASSHAGTPLSRAGRVLRRAALIIGILVDLLGTIFLLQGINLLRGSPMTGEPFWAVVGLVLIVAGSLIVVITVGRGGPPGPR